MSKMLLLFSHTLTPAQEADARQAWGIDAFIALPAELKALWSNIPPDTDDISSAIEPFKAFVASHATAGDVVLIQGDFGATYSMVAFAKAHNITALYATTIRDVIETIEHDKVVKQSVFKHARFRIYKE